MTIEIPQYGLKAYALLFSRHGSKEPFKQSELDWIVSSSMKKKIFALLLRSGWIKKETQDTYSCANPAQAIQGLLEFRVPQVIQRAKKKYAFTQLSAIEIWSDFSYMQRSREKSPYYIKIVKKDIPYWTKFFNQNNITNYVKTGTTIGEYVLLIPVSHFSFTTKDGFNVESLKETKQYAESNEIFAYAAQYMKEKYGASV